MMSARSFLLTFCLIGYVGAESCLNIPKGNPFDCMPAIHDVSDATRKTCNLKTQADITMISGPSCKDVKCVLKENNLLIDDKTDREGLKNIWLEKAKDFPDVINKAYEKCNKEVDINATCEPKLYIVCIKGTVMFNAPDSAWLTTEECNQWKYMMKNCPMVRMAMG